MVFKNTSGGFYTKGLFFETTLADKSTVHYTLKDQDHQGYPSLFRLYMEESDPTEYRFAETHLASWAHWQALTACTWFKPYLRDWRHALELKIKSEALAEIMSLAKASGRDKLAANRFLIEKGWESSGKGRPSKDDIRKAAMDAVDFSSQISEDYSRITETKN